MGIDGIIRKGIGGFYYVEAADGEIYECKAKGIFRNKGITPLAGDRVVISLNDKAENTIDEIKPRTTEMSRPPVANVDRLFIVASTVEPKPVLFIIDKLTALAVDKGIEPVVVFTKCDIEPGDEYAEIYRKVGIKAFCISNKTGGNANDVAAEFEGHISALCGNSGVGKSSLLNAIFPGLDLKTAAISEKLGRGRHTTRHSELFKVNGGYVADTPGFASLVSQDSEFVSKENLPFAFGEFVPYLGKCRFSTCRHVNDKGCKIVEAVERGEIPVSRHESYCMMLEHAESIRKY
ncbi:MAG: ribosome small subunit-dependent GTPase A [Clostridia bacterium]|nr:ribosome small subunit-dependent GTPase A [Clostridia bacterium]